MRVVVSAGAAVTLLAAACTGSGGEATTSLPPPPPTTTATTTIAAAPATTAPTMVPGPVGVAAPPVRSPATDEVFYFVMIDRFANGDPSNDRGGSTEGGPLVDGYLPTDTGFYHGGDVAGLTAQLDYIAGLGVTAIWVTPPFTNRVVQGGGTIGNSSAGYHGYWQVDYTTIDPHVGTNDEMRAFVAAAHDRGIKVFFDAVTNHTGDVITYAEERFSYVGKGSAPYRDARGAEFDDAAVAGSADFPEMDVAVSFPYTPVFATEADSRLKAPDWLDDPVYYHNRGNSLFTGENSLYGDFFGLDDLFTEHPVVVQGMIDIYTAIIDEFDVDGFRVDTVKHVNDEFWQEWVPAILDHARATGKDEFFLFGEVFGESPAFRSHYTTTLDFPAVLDFGFNDAVVAFAAAGASPGALADHFDNDDWYTDVDSNASMLVKFIGNHDIGRIGGFIDTGVARSDEDRLARAELAMAINVLTRGIPLVYYGDEQGFVGDGGDQGARQDMFPSRVDSYNDDDLIGTDATTAGDNFDPGHPLYRFVAEVAEVRAQHPALRHGAQIGRFTHEGGPGIVAVSRIDRDERVEYVVVFNNATRSRIGLVPTATPGATFTAVWPEDVAAVPSSPAGIATVRVPPLGAVVYRADRPVPPSEEAPGIRIVRPRDGAEVVLPRFRVQADLDRDVFAEVTFAVSVDGGEPTVLGTDDAPPYRVYWENTAIPAGATVELMATVDDLSGHRNVATVTLTMGERG